MMEQSRSGLFSLLLAVLLFTRHPQDVDSSPVREARTELQGDWLVTALHYMETNPETLQELLSKDDAVMQGDMMLLTDRNAVGHTWPTQKIPYVISPELASRTEDILAAITMVSEHTCVTFHKRTTEPNYLLFKIGKGCASYVGFIGGEQPVYVAPQCIVGNIVHEILHALGFHHEHTRMDREQHVTIFPHNIMKGMQRNFNKQQGNTFDLPYDIRSIMHYGGGFFSANGQPTIVSIKNLKGMGQRVQMTELDMQKVRNLYKCDAAETQTGKGSGEGDNGSSGSDAEEEKDTNSMMVSFNSTSRGNQSDVAARGQPEENLTVPLQPLDTATGGRHHSSQKTGSR